MGLQAGSGTWVGEGPSSPPEPKENEIPVLVQERENASLKTCPPTLRTNIVQILGRGEDAARINGWIIKKENPNL